MFIALAGNAALAFVVTPDDWLTTTISVMSIVAAVGVIVGTFWQPVEEGSLLLAVAVWTANFFEILFDGDVSAWSKYRLGAFYIAFTLVASAMALRAADRYTYGREYEP
jgi:hypothetical protein